MRNRTELVTTTLPGSENEEDASEVDSEEDWKPEKKKGAKGAVAAKATPKSAAKRKATTAPASAPKPKGRPKKVKKEESEDEEEDFVDEEEDDDDEEEDDEFDDEDDDDDQVSPKGKKTKKSGHYGSGASDAASKPGRRPGNHAKSFPDKDGKFELYLFKNDLVKDFRNDTKMCMWRRDGSSLLQKYIRIQDDDTNRVDVFFTASSVYSCWEEKRKNDFFQINVQCVGEKRDGKVKVVDVPELTRFAAEERPAGADGSAAAGSGAASTASAAAAGGGSNSAAAAEGASATGEEFDEELEEDEEEDEEVEEEE